MKFPSASLLVLLFASVASLSVNPLRAETLTVAVASNFAAAARELAAEFTAEYGVDVRLSVGSTGKLYAQIVNGAPYDVFLAADAERPAALERASLIAPGSRFVYAIGALAFWSASRDLGNCAAVLLKAGHGKVAIANPAHAPYGKAALEYLQVNGLYEHVVDDLVYGENIAQAFQFVATGNADYGFVALSLLSDDQRQNVQCGIRMDDLLRHEAVVLKRAATSGSAAQFVRFLHSEAAQRTIRLHGYAAAES
ncbi:MAG: molybdate ABC transporter substrate-binding protein [Woeseiaceae bacterium]|nr:molybdate ABC transporter substrate-binding protein [Woeseiaceae bacterium]